MLSSNIGLAARDGLYQGWGIRPLAMNVVPIASQGSYQAELTVWDTLTGFAYFGVANGVSRGQEGRHRGS